MTTKNLIWLHIYNPQNKYGQSLDKVTVTVNMITVKLYIIAVRLNIDNEKLDMVTYIYIPLIEYDHGLNMITIKLYVTTVRMNVDNEKLNIVKYSTE